MPPKRKASPEAEPDPEFGESSTAADGSAKAGKGKLKYEKAYKSIEATEAAVRAREPNTTDKGDTSKWLPKLALHLATTPHFINELSKAPTADQVTLSQEWLADVFLQGRVNRYKSFQVSRPCSRRPHVIPPHRS